MLEPAYAPSSDDPSEFGGGPLHPTASIGGGERGGSQIWQPCDPPAASRDLPPGIGLRLIWFPHRHPGAWRTFHMDRLKGVPFRSLNRRPLYSYALSGCSSVMYTSFRPLEMGLL
ncbi:hypothetical protein SLEP1_g40547 [Rubroshorea leprosula]|uniref:Uncharacterized protein n=1 Tax=Rubroshorea leprosula TaxID=152421 RepID=A0AAV5L4B3_9ROSI|nr:hypothetical protein SLEP1_g40547 [Rubroshorea leprosula]